MSVICGLALRVVNSSFAFGSLLTIRRFGPMKRGAMLEYTVSFKKDSITYKGKEVNSNSNQQHKSAIFIITWLGNNLTAMPCL